LLQNYLNEKHDIEAKYVRYDDKDKYDKIEWFQIPGKHVKKIMINVNLLQEGFDNKYVDSIIFMNS
jgi:excinuclease UvrABC helicase subunit UvrB